MKLDLLMLSLDPRRHALAPRLDLGIFLSGKLLKPIDEPLHPFSRFLEANQAILKDLGLLIGSHRDHFHRDYSLHRDRVHRSPLV